MTGRRVGILLSVIAASAMWWLPQAGWAEAEQERVELFRETITVGAQIDAMDEKCRRLEAKDTSMDRPVVEQVMEGFALEEPSPDQIAALQESADEAFTRKMEALDAQPDVKCESSDFLWEKHALTKTLSARLKKIIKSRDEASQPKPL